MSAASQPSGVSPASAIALPMVWVDGRRMDALDAHISVLDRGFTLGDGLFETMRLYDGVIFRLERHLARLVAGAAVLQLPLSDDIAGLVQRAVHAAVAEGCREASVRLTVSRGWALPGLGLPNPTRPTLALLIAPILHHDAPRALSLRVASGRRNEFSPTVGVKTTAYADAVVALAEARAQGADDALLLDTRGHVSEATASNVFVVHDDVLLTPHPSCGILLGITRHAVLELAARLDLPAAERAFTLRELGQASECFLTSSLRELAPVTRLDGVPVGAGAVGPITHRLIEAYAQLVQRECAG